MHIHIVETVSDKSQCNGSLQRPPHQQPASLPTISSGRVTKRALCLFRRHSAYFPAGLKSREIA
jgi:hypothetical protein